MATRFCCCLLVQLDLLLFCVAAGSYVTNVTEFGGPERILAEINSTA
jgi:hypothetical protein